MKFVIISAGQSARLVASVVNRQSDHECAGFIDNDLELQGQVFHGHKVIGTDDDLETLAHEGISGVYVAIGNVILREHILSKMQSIGFGFLSIIDPTSEILAGSEHGDGLFMSLRSTVLNDTKLGANLFIGTNVHILHDVVVGDNCLIAGSSTVGANVEMGDNVFVGVGAVIASGAKKIGNNAMIGAGSVVLDDVPDDAFVLGNPARAIGKNPNLQQ